MRTQTLIGVVASLGLNFAALIGLDWSARESASAPEGVVSIVQLPDASELHAYAQVPGAPSEARL